MLARSWHATVATLVLVGVVVQVWVAVEVSATPPGHAVGTLAGTALPGRLLRTFSFFTVQSNVLSGLVSWQLARRPHRDGPGFRVARLDALFGIAITGIVYATVLARIHEPHGWRETLANTIFHYAVPVLMVLGWLLFGPRPRVAGRVVLWSLAWPLAWFGYTMVAGAVSKWYPYPFVDVATQGYARVIANAALVTALFAAVAGLFLLGDRRLRAAPGGR